MRRWPTARLTQLEVDSEGLDALDHRYLGIIAKNYDGGPVGIETMAAALSEPRDALEEIVEPYLLQQGFVSRTAARSGADAEGLSAHGAVWSLARRHTATGYVCSRCRANSRRG